MINNRNLYLYGNTPVLIPEMDGNAKCIVCGNYRPVCCNTATIDLPFVTAHIEPVCIDCCDSSPAQIWEGKSVAGGTYSRCDCEH